MDEIVKLYTSLGGRFISSPAEITRRLRGVKAFVFDWDGVFNGGYKSSSGGSNFSEVDSMGVNLLRFSYFRVHGELPLTLAISGETNKTAFYYSERENFNYSFYKVAHKIHALNFLCEQEKIDPSQVCYFFDDVLDIPIAEKCGLRVQINQQSNPLFADYCTRHKLVDYLTASHGGKFALREATELLIALGGEYDHVINARKNNSEPYRQYIAARKMVRTAYYTLAEEGIRQQQPDI